MYKRNESLYDKRWFKMLKDLRIGTEFYYVDIHNKKIRKCTIDNVLYQNPRKIYATDNETLETLVCYPEYECYPLTEYEQALKDITE